MALARPLDMLSIVYQDNHILCVDKPGGLLTQPSGTDRDSIESQAKAWVKEKFSKPGAVFLEAVHRIDAPACGIVLFARTSKALSRMSAAMRDGRCTKEYRIVTDKAPARPSMELRNWLVHGDHVARLASPGEPDAHEAVLSYRVLKTFGNGSALVQVFLKSGRYHQIRAQFAGMGCPVMGDSRYGSVMPFRPGCIALQHYRLVMPHPTTGENLEFTSGMDLVELAAQSLKAGGRRFS